MTNTEIKTLSKYLKERYPNFDDFTANEVVYLVEHARRLDISVLELLSAVSDIYQSNEESE